MRELTPYLRLLAARRGRLLVGAMLMLTTVASAVGLLGLAGWFITASAVTGLLLAAGVQARLEIYVPGGGIRFLALSRTVSRYFERVWNHDSVLRLLADLRADFFARLTPLDPGTLARFRGAQLLQRLTADIDALDNLYLRALAPPTVALLAIALVGVLLALFAPVAGLTATAILLVSGVLLAGVAWRAGAEPGRRLGMTEESLRIRVIETIQGLAEWRAFGTLDRQRERVDALDQARTRDQVRLARFGSAAEAAAGLAVHLAVLASLSIGVVLHARGAIPGPMVALMPLAVLALNEALTPVPGAILQLGRTRVAARRLNEQAATKPAIRDPVRPSPLPARHDLRFDAIHFTHSSADAAVLCDLDLVVRDGRRLAILGRSGCGKSTIADLVCRLIEPDQGCILLGGTDIAALRLRDLHGRIGYLTQRTELIADSIAANLRLAAPQSDESALWRVLEKVELAEFVDDLPQGLATWVGESGVRLSGGQGRRLALARVMLKDSPVAVLDEPLAGLDAAVATGVSAALDTWLRGRTTLLLAHDADALPPADDHLHLGPSAATA